MALSATRRVSSGWRRVPFGWCRVSFGWRLGAIAGAAAVWRIAMYLAVYRHRIFGFNDAVYYSQQAVQLAHGHWFTDPLTGGPVGEHGPLISVVLASLSRFGQPHEWQRAGTLVIGVATVAVLGLAGRALGGRRVGLLAAAVAAAYPGLWINDGIVMSEGLTALLVAVWLLVGQRYLRTPSAGRAAWLGAVAGLAALTRSELVLLALAGALLVWRVADQQAHRRHALVVVAACLVVLAPWVGPNLVRFQHPVLLSTNDGTTLRGANCDRSYVGRAIGSWSVFCLVIDPDTVALEPSVRSARWRDDGLRYAADHTGRVPVVVAARVARTLDLYGLGYQVDEDARDGRPRLGSWLTIVSFWLAAPVAVLGLARMRGRPRWLLLAPVVTVAMSTVVFYGGHRIRAPLEPVIVLGVAVVCARRRARIAT